MSKIGKDRLSGTSDQLLPGTGYTPSYGTTDSLAGDSADMGASVMTAVSSAPSDPGNRNGKERVWVVARCALTACLASFVAGMTGGFSSPALQDLSNPNLTTPAQYFSDSSVLHSIFAVS